MHQVPLVRIPFDRRVLVHRGDDNPVGQHQLTKPERMEHGRDVGLDRLRHSVVGAGIPGIHLLHVAGIAQAEVVVSDSLAPGQHAEDELLRVEVPVAVRTLEPLEAGAGRSLQALDLRAPRPLIRGEGVVERRSGDHHPGQGDGVLHRQLGPRPHREMGGMSRITDEDHVFVMPEATGHRRKAQPLRVVAQQPAIFEELREDLGTPLDCQLIADTWRESLIVGGVEPEG